MADFVIYHNEDKQGRLGSKGDDVFRIWTNKPNPERLLGQHRVWLVSGVGAPKRWSLHSWFVPSEIEDVPGGKSLYGKEGARSPLGGGVRLDQYDWFKRLYVKRQLYSFGLQSLASKEGLQLVMGFEEVAKDWPKSGSVQKPTTASRAQSRIAKGVKPQPREMETLAMNIKREWFAAIVAGRKSTEYRKVSAFWRRRIEPLTPPFKLRLLNGMLPPVPEATVVVTKVSRAGGEYQLHLGKVVATKHWDRERERPKA